MSDEFVDPFDETPDAEETSNDSGAADAATSPTADGAERSGLPPASAPEPAWIAEAHKKRLPREWVETLAASDGFTEKQKAIFVKHITGPEDFAAKRAKAIDIGRRYGEDEARSRRESPEYTDQRVRRAMAYAAWEFDGKPLSSKAQREEFGVVSPDITPSLLRAAPLMVVPKEKKK